MIPHFPELLVEISPCHTVPADLGERCICSAVHKVLSDGGLTKHQDTEREPVLDNGYIGFPQKMPICWILKPAE